jgi:pimeloyl-ACP methyl ester carboxylesterase
MQGELGFRMRFQIGWMALLALLALTGCSAPYAKVKESPIRRTALFVPRLLTGLFGDNKQIARAIHEEAKHPEEVLGAYLQGLKISADALEKSPSNTELRDAYNFALSRVLATIRKGKLDPWTKPLPVTTAEGEYLITHYPDKRPGWVPAAYDLVPCTELELSGKYVGDHVTKAGLGAPLVAIGKNENANSKENFSTQRVYYGVTAVARFEGRRCVIKFEDPLSDETVRFQGSNYPLAADFTAPLAFMLAKEKLAKLELKRLLKPEKYDFTERLARLQPYDPSKTIVLVIHGLKDSQATWVPLLNHLRGDAFIRQHYQFWFFSYPTGYPYPYSAALLRRELNELEKVYPQKKPMVVIGHSMGGCISRLLITDGEPELWNRYFGKEARQLGMKKETADLYGELLNFSRRREIGRVVFIAAPLQGSHLAANWVGRIGSRLVRLPSALVETGADAMRYVLTLDEEFLRLKSIPNSVDTLAPNNRFVKTINTLPLADDVPYHTIVGDRGKGGNTDKTKPMRSDGVVPYWSSHLPGAQSELIVPSGHSAHKHPAAIEEVRRILYLHSGRR